MKDLNNFKVNQEKKYDYYFLVLVGTWAYTKYNR